MQVTIVKRGDNVFCQGVERMIPVHPDHLKYFEDRIGEVVEIELKEVEDLHTVKDVKHGVIYHDSTTYAVPKVDEWAGVYETIKDDPLLVGRVNVPIIRVIAAMQKNYTITKKS